MNGEVINRTHPESEWFGFWCPVCEKIRKKPRDFLFWLLPDRTLVCNYVICRKCADLMRDAPQALQAKLADKVERNLLTHYPQLEKQLPPGYMLRSKINGLLELKL